MRGLQTCATFANVNVMETSREKKPLSVILAGQPVGMWVVLDPDMTKIIGTALTPEEALRQAGVMSESAASSFDRVIGERPVMLQVSDPKLVCFY